MTFMWGCDFEPSFTSSLYEHILSESIMKGGDMPTSIQVAPPIGCSGKGVYGRIWPQTANGT